MRAALRSLLVVASLLTTTSAALAEELYAVVDRTSAPGERAIVRVRSDTPGPVLLLAYRVEDPAVLLDAGLDLSRGDLVHRRLHAAIARARAGAGGEVAALGDAGTPSAPDAALDVRLTFVARATGTLAARAVAAPPSDDEAAPARSEATVEVAVPASGLYVVEVRHGSLSTAVPVLASRIALVTKRDPGGLLAWAVDRTGGAPLPRVTVEVRSGAEILAKGVTDERGLVRLEGKFPPTAEVRATKDDDLAVGAETYVPADVEDRRVYVFAHQPAYRPGERVEAKGIVRAWRGGAYAIDADVREVEVRFVAAGDRLLGKAVAPVSPDLGTFAASCDLPKDAPTGDARIVVAIGERTYEGPFRVDAYRMPSFEVGVRPKAPRVAPGEAATFEVEGAFYEGGPVSGAPLEWTLQFHRVDRDLFPTDELARLFFGTEREAFAAKEVARGTATLDAAGRATVTASVPALREDGFLTLRALVTGPDRTVVAGSGTVGYAATPLTVALRTDRHLYGAEGVAQVRVRAQLADGSPASGRAGVLTTARVTAAAREGGRPPEERVVGSFPFTTDATGAAVLEVPFAENGRYAVSVAVPRAPDEPAGPPAAATVHVWVAGDRADVGYAGDRLEVVADRDTYAVGDVARLLVLAPVGGRPFLRTTEGPRLLSWETVALGGPDDRGAAAVVEVRVGPEHVPSGYLGVALVDQGNVLATVKMLRVPPVDRLLHPTVEAPKTDLEPGETVALRARVRDAAGAPVAGAEVSVAVVDEALHALFGAPGAAIEPFFHSVRRNDVRIGGPVHVTSVGWAVAAIPATKEEETTGGVGGRRPMAGGAIPGVRNVTEPTGPPPPAAAPGAPPARDAAGADHAESEAGEALERSRLGDDGSPRKQKGDGGGEGPLSAREDFRAAVWWSPAVRTGADGTASVGPVRFAESLTRWRITSVAVDAGTRVGSSTTTVRTRKQVLTRLTAPRFLRATDTARVPWTLHSLLEVATEGEAFARAEGLSIEAGARRRVPLAPGAVATSDLLVTAPTVGDGRLVAELRTDHGSDAVLLRVPVLPQGVPKVLAASAVTEGALVALPPLALPPTAERGSARIRILVEPSVAQAIGAALPYLIDYPHGCTEQTMSRLVPVVVAKAAKDRFGLPPEGRLADLPALVDAGVARLRQLRHADGGFGWWEADPSDPYMTAYVLHGLSRATEVLADPGPAKDLAAGASAWLVRWLSQTPTSGEGDPAPEAVARAFAWMALADAQALPEGALPALPPGETPTLARAFLLRARLSGGQRQAEVPALLDAIAAAAVRDAHGVHWGQDAAPTRWAEDPVETTAWVLGALAQAKPDHPDLEPGVRWLLAQRAGGDRWRSTRDTAACVACLTRYLVVTGDLGAGRTVRLTRGGAPWKEVTVTPQTAFSGATIDLPWEDGIPGPPLALSASSDGGLARVTALLAFTETGPAIEPASSGFEVTRQWWLLTPVAGPDRPRLARKAVTESVPSGALLDVEVVVRTATDREMVLVTSPHAAGFEPEREMPAEWAGEPPPAAARADHVDRLDDRTVFFSRRLPAGTHVFRHRVRAVHAGSFTALPAQAELMYFPEVRGNGKGEVLEISPAGPAGAADGGR